MHAGDWITMQITLNGEVREIPDTMTAEQLVTLLGLGEKRLAMEVNLEIVPRSHDFGARLWVRLFIVLSPSSFLFLPLL